ETLATGYRSQAGFSLLKVLLAAVLFTMSWNDFLRLPYGLTVPNTLLALFIVLFTIRYLVEIDNARIYKRMFFYEESFLAVFFIFSVISYCINYEYSSISPILFFALAYLFFLS